MLRKFGIIFIKLAPVLLAIKILILLLAKYFVVSSCGFCWSVQLLIF